MRKMIAAAGLSVCLCPVSLVQGGVFEDMVFDRFDDATTSHTLGDRQVDSQEFANAYGLDSSFVLDPNFDTGSRLGALVMSADPGVGRTGSLVYNNNGAGLNLNANALNFGQFKMDFHSVDQSFIMQVTMSTYNAMGDVSGYVRWAVQVDQGMYVQERWDLQNFTSFGGIFRSSDIDEIQILFNVGNNPPGIALDFVATDFATTIIPAPGTAMTLGFTGLLLTRRRRS